MGEQRSKGPALEGELGRPGLCGGRQRMGAPPPCFFPWNPSHIGASFKDESLASLADGTLVDAYYGSRSSYGLAAPAQSSCPQPRPVVVLPGSNFSTPADRGGPAS